MHGIVIAGGIGGMALAAAFERVGISFEVHEQVEQLREVGAGLMLCQIRWLPSASLARREG